MNKIGPQIRAIRQKKQLTQDQLVARCNLLPWEISRSTLAKIESRVRRITDIEIIMISKALNVDVQVLFE
ncbi:MAG: helix-turn-helix domain-containing protein [Colwellia sp.]